VRRSHIHGWGLFLTRDVEADEMVVEYAGEVIRQKVGVPSVPFSLLVAPAHAGCLP
jgi:hypothetical protein